MLFRSLVPFISVFLASCITLNPEEPTTVTTPVVKPLVEINKPASPEAPFYVAVYQFSDKTGQRRPSEMVAHLSSAVTQGGETWLIKALQDADPSQDGPLRVPEAMYRPKKELDQTAPQE